MSSYLAQVYSHTLKITRQLSNEGQLNLPDSQVFVEVDQSYRITKKYDTHVNIQIVNGDTFDIAAKFASECKTKPFILNMASDYCPGGGVRKGSSAQEEELFRRSDYWMHLVPLKQQEYPLLKSKAILNRGVTVIKRSGDYKNQRPFFVIDCLAIAAIRNPKLKHGKYSETDELIMRNKIKQIYQVAAKNGSTCLVLGALGCGAFGNPPLEVARLFKEELQPYINTFQSVVFAILCDQNDIQNIKCFQQIFERN
jgi:uncharacterized protein (TIGR02452 family)